VLKRRINPRVDPDKAPADRYEKVAGVGPQKGLVDLAASVADGHLIDWEALEADAQSEYDR
jgi:hypothetical protein